MKLDDKIVKKYWDEKAEREGRNPEVTIRDHNFRELEQDVLKSYLEKDDHVLDVSCGNGYSTLVYAQAVKDIIGVDYSEVMVKRAEEYRRLRALLVHNIEFRCADARNLPFSDQSFQVVIMERCLINIPDLNGQKEAVKEVHRVLMSQGLFLLAEVTPQGHEKINHLRTMFGLDKLKTYWHNTYLNEEEFIPFLHQ